MKKTILFAALLFVIPPPVAAAPRIKSAGECAVIADMALVAASAAKQGVSRPQALAMMPDIYQIRTEEGNTVASLVVDAAYTGTHREDPRAFANNLGSTCMRTQGDVDAILGAGS